MTLTSLPKPRSVGVGQVWLCWHERQLVACYVQRVDPSPFVPHTPQAYFRRGHEYDHEEVGNMLTSERWIYLGHYAEHPE